MEQQKAIGKKTLYAGSAVVVTAGMGAIKLLATVVNKTVAFVLENVT